jgi:putative alpha-1,2-mannosidase
MGRHAGTALLALLLAAAAREGVAGREPVDYVDPLIGTSNSRWMLGPYAGVPFGMVQLGPDNQGPGWMSGYEYSIANVTGFSHIHAWTMGGLMLMPSSRRPRRRPRGTTRSTCTIRTSSRR